MGKKYRLLFVMSIISFVLSILCIFGAVTAAVYANKIMESDSTAYDIVNVILIFFGLSTLIVLSVLFLIAIIAALMTALLGVLGIACCKQQGKCSLGCLILGGILSLLAAANIVIGNINVSSFLILAYFGLYTAGAAAAFPGQKTISDEQFL